MVIFNLFPSTSCLYAANRNYGLNVLKCYNYRIHPEYFTKISYLCNEVLYVCSKQV